MPRIQCLGQTKARKRELMLRLETAPHATRGCVLTLARNRPRETARPASAAAESSIEAIAKTRLYGGSRPAAGDS